MAAISTAHRLPFVWAKLLTQAPVSASSSAFERELVTDVRLVFFHLLKTVWMIRKRAGSPLKVSLPFTSRTLNKISRNETALWIWWRRRGKRSTWSGKLEQSTSRMRWVRNSQDRYSRRFNTLMAFGCQMISIFLLQLQNCWPRIYKINLLAFQCWISLTCTKYHALR